MMFGAKRISLCGSCSNARPVQSQRGSEFILCKLSQDDPDYDKYPWQPVLYCRGFAASVALPGSNPTANPSEN